MLWSYLHFSSSIQWCVLLPKTGSGSI